MSDTETDRLWSALDKANQYMETLEARLLRLETTRAPERPTRAVGDYLPDPVRQQAPAADYSAANKDAACAIEEICAILAEMLPPSGIPSPAQRLLLRVRAELGMGDP